MALILVVDDDEDVRNVLRRFLSSAGYDVLVAEDAVVAGHLIASGAPDLMILDVNMPYMDGFEFAQALRDDESIPYIPIIFLTSREDGYERAMALGAVAYQLKPISAPGLMVLVKEHLPIDGP